MTEPVSHPPDAPDDASRREMRLAKTFGSSMMWNLVNNLITNVITLVVFIFLTYQLDPVVFGIFALGVIIVDYFAVQGRSACIDAAVQRHAYSPVEMDTVFWSTMAVAIIVALVTVVAGRWLAAANGEPSLALVMPALGLTLLAIPLSLPPNAVMMRDHDFRGGAIRGILSAIIGGIAAFLVVIGPAPEWALVAQRAAQSITSAVVMALRVKWFPGLSFSMPYASSYLNDAGRIFAAQAIASSQLRALDLVMAFSFGAAAVGLMRIASRFVELVNAVFIAPISSIWVVLLSEEGSTRGDRNLLYCRLSQMTALIALPIFGGIAVVADDVLTLILSPEYQPAGPMLALFCAAGLLAPLTYFRNAAMIAVKRLNLLIGYSVLDILIITVAAIALSQISAIAVVAALIVLEVARLAMTVPLLLKDMHTRASDLFAAVFPAYAATATMAGVVWLFSGALGGVDPWLAFGVKVAVGATAYVAYLATFHRAWSLDAIRMLRPNQTGDAARTADAAA
jgi:teichuronic acid exporter